MKTNLEFTEQRYYLNNDKKTATCLLKGRFRMNPNDCTNNLIDILKRTFPKASVYHHYVYVEFKGTSKCHKDDKYDEILGKRIAESRAKSKAYRFVEKAAKVIARYYNSLYENNASLKVYANTLKISEITHVHDLQKQ